MTTTSIPRRPRTSERLKTSRINRLALFLLTASPSFLEATIPSLPVPVSFGATRIVRYRPFVRSDRSNTRWNSPRRLTRRSFEKRSDGMGSPSRALAPAVATRRKPRGAYAPSRGGASEPGALSWSPCARGTHACACGAGGLAGTSHSLSDPLQRKNKGGETSIVTELIEDCQSDPRQLRSVVGAEGVCYS